ncbi:MAG: hypothetical protein ACRELF_10785 [Gemmataceae bacterium]
MDDSNSFAVADKEIVGPWISGFTAVKSVLFHVKFDYGAGGAACDVHLQTSVDNGATATGISAFRFGKASGSRFANLSSGTPRQPFAPREKLNPDEAEDGVIGDMLRVVICPTGKFENSSITAGIVTRTS